jgi:hypothetical protein
MHMHIHLPYISECKVLISQRNRYAVQKVNVNTINQIHISTPSPLNMQTRMVSHLPSSLGEFYSPKTASRKGIWVRGIRGQLGTSAISGRRCFSVLSSLSVHDFSMTLVVVFFLGGGHWRCWLRVRREGIYLYV